MCTLIRNNVFVDSSGNQPETSLSTTSLANQLWKYKNKKQAISVRTKPLYPVLLTPSARTIFAPKLTLTAKHKSEKKNVRITDDFNSEKC